MGHEQPCPHCGATIDPEEFEFHGRDDEEEIEVECPKCGKNLDVERTVTIEFDVRRGYAKEGAGDG